MRKGKNTCPIDCRKRSQEKKIKSICNRIRFRIWGIFHPKKYKKQKEMFRIFDEMHENDPGAFKIVYLARRINNADHSKSP